VSRGLNSTNYGKLRRAIKAARAESGMTQEQVAAKMRRPQSFVSKVESGQRHLDIVEFIDLCRAIGISPSTVLQPFGD
jgi:transcriptional regulator with XRE-family HTH domain